MIERHRHLQFVDKVLSDHLGLSFFQRIQNYEA
jgi:hypothetical protein